MGIGYFFGSLLQVLASIVILCTGPCAIFGFVGFVTGRDAGGMILFGIPALVALLVYELGAFIKAPETFSHTPRLSLTLVSLLSYVFRLFLSPMSRARRNDEEFDTRYGLKETAGPAIDQTIRPEKGETHKVLKAAGIISILWGCVYSLLHLFLSHHLGNALPKILIGLGFVFVGEVLYIIGRAQNKNSDDAR